MCIVEKLLYKGEIAQKFEDSILFYNAMKMERHGKEASSGIPLSLVTVGDDIRYVLYLIIHGHKMEWIPPIQDELRDKLRHVLRAWNIKDFDVKVVNHQTALELRLIEKFFPIEELEKLRGKSPEEKQLAAENWLQGS